MSWMQPAFMIHSPEGKRQLPTLECYDADAACCMSMRLPSATANAKRVVLDFTQIKPGQLNMCIRHNSTVSAVEAASAAMQAKKAPHSSPQAAASHQSDAQPPGSTAHQGITSQPLGAMPHGSVSNINRASQNQSAESDSSHTQGSLKDPSQPPSPDHQAQLPSADHQAHKAATTAAAGARAALHPQNEQRASDQLPDASAVRGNDGSGDCQASLQDTSQAASEGLHATLNAVKEGPRRRRSSKTGLAAGGIPVVPEGGWPDWDDGDGMEDGSGMCVHAQRLTSDPEGSERAAETGVMGRRTTGEHQAAGGLAR